MPSAFKITLPVFDVGAVLTLLFLPALEIAWFRIKASHGATGA